MTRTQSGLPPNDMTGDHDPDPEACTGEQIAYDWDDDPDAEEVTDGDPHPVAGEAA